MTAMFLDKPVVERNAVQTVSRLNRCHHGKKDVVVVDFINNARRILKAFAKYRTGTPFEPEEPDQDLCPKLHVQILAAGVFTQKDAAELLKLIKSGTDAQVQWQVLASLDRGFLNGGGASMNIRLMMRARRALSHRLPAHGLS
ncbi:MAG: hypothetical protein HY322_13600, partial [Betaproteobacteria bacterium]|nr:hypothetical protein [Betaproteobacteria bacterium]